MGQGEDKLINDAVCAYSTGDEGEGCIVRIAEDEMMCVECRKSLFADASSALSSAQSHSVTRANAISRPLPKLYSIGEKGEGGSRHRRYMIHIRLRNHGSHCLLHSPLPKLIETMLIPHSF